MKDDPRSRLKNSGHCPIGKSNYMGSYQSQIHKRLKEEVDLKKTKAYKSRKLMKQQIIDLIVRKSHRDFTGARMANFIKSQRSP